MSTYERIADLPLEIDGYTLEGLSKTVSSGFERHTTVIRLQGGGEEGLGEDVTYETEDQLSQQEHGPQLPLAGRWTVASFSAHLGELDTFPGGGPKMPVYRNYRRWGFESAALDLALRQAGRSLADVLGREPRPVTFVVSSRMGEPPTLAPVTRRLARYPDLRFKLDGTPDWDDELIDGLVETGAVDSIDFKGAYKGTAVDVATDPAFYRRIAETFPDAWLEDPDLEDEAAREALAPYEDRITWDAPIHSVDDILAQRVLPKTVNLKPSRFGSIEALFAGYDFCEERGMGAYGGGQYELGVGRGQIQYLAAIFHPDAPNDIAPAGYDALDPEPGLPASPLEPEIDATGFRRRA
jgi:L-alanine-DL-glutamate epimerase-like enolase superfamily enzyme